MSWRVSSLARRRFTVVAVLMAGYAMLVSAWLVTDPLGRTPDEPAHYIRALAVGSGQIFGERTTVGVGGFTKVQHDWVQAQQRVFTLPSGLGVFPLLPCSQTIATLSAGCQRGWPPVGPRREPSYVGSYQPYTYVPPGLLMRLGGTPWTAWVIGRVTIAALALGLLTVGVAAYWSDTRPAVAIVGVAVAITPMALFLAGSLSPSALEIAGGFAYTAGLLAALRDGRPTTTAWAAVALGGVMLAVSRSLGPYFVVTIAAAIAIAIGMRHAWQRVVAARLRAAVAGACIVVAAVANLAWEQTQQPHLALRPSLLADASVGRLPSIAREMVGRFGWLEFGLPEPTYWLWAGLVLVLAGVAVAVGRWRERIAIIGLIVGVAALIYAFHAVLLPETGFDAQGRYFLPIAVAVPLLAGETLMRRGLRLRAGVLTGLALGGTALAAAVQGLAWYVNARRYAVGTGGPRWFLGREQWVPPGGGWVVWLAVAGLGTACLVAAGIGSARPWGVSLLPWPRGRAPAARGAPPVSRW